MYVPSLAVLSHHFHSRRSMAMSLVATGASLGAIVHPIMLNNTLHGSLGFAKATRISAGMVSMLLLTACILIRTRAPLTNQPVLDIRKCLYKFSRDKPYVAFTIGYVCRSMLSSPVSLIRPSAISFLSQLIIFLYSTFNLMRFLMGLANGSPFTQFCPIHFPPPCNRLTFGTNS